MQLEGGRPSLHQPLRVPVRQGSNPCRTPFFGHTSPIRGAPFAHTRWLTIAALAISSWTMSLERSRAPKCALVLGRQTGDDVGMPIPVMLATLTDRRDFGDDWLMEQV